jgi:hypothetical protein
MNTKIAILAAFISAGSLQAGEWNYQGQRDQWDRLWEQGQRMQDEQQRQNDRFEERLERQREENERRVRDMQEDCDY